MKQQHILHIITLLLIVIVVCHPGIAGETWAASQKQIILVAPEGQGYLMKLSTLIYTDAFQRLGYQLVVKEYPAKRASVLSDSGQVDGELGRVANYHTAPPEMLRVDESSIWCRNWPRRLKRSKRNV